MIYLNNAATSWPKPESVYNAVDRLQRKIPADFSRSNFSADDADAQTLWNCRCLAAELFGITAPERIIFTFNATDSINIALKGILRRGDHIVISDMEHNAVYRPVMKMKESGLIDVTIVPSGGSGVLDAASMVKYFNVRTRLAVIVHESNVTGSVNDLSSIGEVCRNAGVILMVDASQSAGCVLIDAARDHIGVLAAPGHKGLYGVPGSGILYFSPEISADTLREGGTGSESKLYTQPQILPDRFESGTMNIPAIAGLAEGIRFVLETGIANISEHKKQISSMIRAGLQSLRGVSIYSVDDARLISFSLAGRDTSDICNYLSDQGIVVRGGLHCSYLAHKKNGTLDTGMVRVSPGYFNVPEDAESFLLAVKQYLKKIK